MLAYNQHHIKKRLIVACAPLALFVGNNAGREKFSQAATAPYPGTRRNLAVFPLFRGHTFDPWHSSSRQSMRFPQQHRRQICAAATSSWACGVCHREFISEQALKQHQEAKGHDGGLIGSRKRRLGDGGKNIDELTRLKPPFEGLEGRWVHRRDFEGIKSFGVFHCECGNTWSSAHARREYRQGCQSCEKMWLPRYMWVNTGERQERDDEGDDDRPPHDQERCEACRRLGGDCRDYYG